MQVTDIKYEPSRQDAIKSALRQARNLAAHMIVIDLIDVDKITPELAKNLFGSLLIDEAYRSVAIENFHLTGLDDNLFILLEGIQNRYREVFPDGIQQIGGVRTMSPQIEVFNASGDDNFNIIKLEDNVYQAIKRNEGAV